MPYELFNEDYVKSKAKAIAGELYQNGSASLDFLPENGTRYEMYLSIHDKGGTDRIGGPFLSVVLPEYRTGYIFVVYDSTNTYCHWQYAENKLGLRNESNARPVAMFISVIREELVQEYNNMRY